VLAIESKQLGNYNHLDCTAHMSQLGQKAMQVFAWSELALTAELVYRVSLLLVYFLPGMSHQ